MNLPFFQKTGRHAGRSPFHILLIALLGLLAYSNTLNAPFQWDEEHFIVENPLIKDLSYFLDWEKAKGLEQYGALKNRYIGFLTFALNYKAHGLDVRGYHIFNITIHILNAILVYFLIVLTFKTPFLEKSRLKEHSRFIAFFSSLLFVSHPIQTEAVTYIFQRLASLCAFFYILSLVFYIKWRLGVFSLLGSWGQSPHYKSTGGRGGFLYYLLSILSAVLAMKTKENAFTLPIIIALYEFSFFRGPVKKRIFFLIPILLTMLIIPLTLIDIDNGILGTMDAAMRGYEDISRPDYLSTEFRVIVTYIRLLFLPINQNIDYDYPVFNSFLNPEVLFSFVFLAATAGLGAYLFYRSKMRNPDLRLIAFGVFWFFITLSTESSVIPLPMVINEYRVYLPSVGIFVAIQSVIFLLVGRVINKRAKSIFLLLAIFIPLVLSGTTYSRNTLWKNEISLWEDTVRKSPHKARGHYFLGLSYNAEKMTDKAVEQFKITISLNPRYAEAYNNIGIAYRAKGLLDDSIAYLRVAIGLRPDYAEAHNNIAASYSSKGLTDKAIEHFRIAIKIKPDFEEARFNLGVVYLGKGDLNKAHAEFETILRTNPNHNKAKQFLKYINESALELDI